MKIALVAPSSVPFTIGGAENLFWGLQEYINDATPHDCELIKLPSRENDFFEIVDSYKTFSTLNITHFDAAISTKYPSWIVSHHNHICYMLHTLRGLYDSYHFMNQPTEFDWESDKSLSALNAYMKRALEKPDHTSLLEFFDHLEKLQTMYDTSELFRFPGPFSRQIVHFLDSWGLAQSKITRYAAISRTVAQRDRYFPAGSTVSVLYPPPKLTNFHCGGDDYLFTVSRLDSPKRVSLLIEAMSQVTANIPLLIGGIGPELERLKSMTNGDSRIKFLGFLSSEQIVEFYSNALAVPFVPYDEDYGYITIEAMRSGKPVLTVSDSGGPNEFVIDGETGFSVPPDPAALANSINYLCSHREEARLMGKRARESVSFINWETVLGGLLGEPVARKTFSVPKQTASHQTHSSTRKKLVVAVTFPIFPPRGGGQSRVFHLYKNLARHFDIEIVSLCGCDEPFFSQEIAPKLIETRIPKSREHQDREIEYSKSVNWVPVTDIVVSKTYSYSPDFVSALRTACSNAFIVVASHPYLVAAIREVAPELPLWFEAHNVEYTLKKNILPKNDASILLLEMVKHDENKCWSESELVFACSQDDIQALEALYGNTLSQKIVVPNGASLEDVRFVSDSERRMLKNKLGIHTRKTALFMGSWHGPNLEAIEHIISLSAAFPDIIFLIVGSAGLAFKDRTLPENIIMLGVVDDDEKNVLLGSADVALNPMTSGSGTNLKILDYFFAGIPVVSTRFGVRGIDVVEGKHYISAEINSFVMELTLFFASPESYAHIPGEARLLAESSYAWDVIAENFYQAIMPALENKR